MKVRVKVLCPGTGRVHLVRLVRLVDRARTTCPRVKGTRLPSRPSPRLVDLKSTLHALSVHPTRHPAPSLSLSLSFSLSTALRAGASLAQEFLEKIDLANLPSGETTASNRSPPRTFKFAKTMSKGSWLVDSAVSDSHDVFDDEATTALEVDDPDIDETNEHISEGERWVFELISTDISSLAHSLARSRFARSPGPSAGWRASTATAG